MSNDRELLELAAKAAGIEFHIDNLDACPKLVINGRVWNPLTDDGDALRLAVKLEINILPSMEECSARNPGYSAWNNELATTDPYAATRRAIVRAAAEIGRNMP